MNPARTLLAVLSVLATISVPAVTAPASQADALRDVVIVGNSTAGTVTFLDGRTFGNIRTLDVTPDKQQRIDEMDPVRRAAYETIRKEVGDKFVDDAHLSPDGRTIFVSRGNLGDAVAVDVASGQQKWRVRLDGFKADHATLSPDGTRFVISAITAQKVQVIDTATGRVTGSFATGSYPHENMYSPDGGRIYNMSIGLPSLPKWMNWAKGAKQITVVDARTLQQVRTYDFEYGVRPAVITPDERTMYLQLSYLNGFAEFDLVAGRITRTVQMPFSEAGRKLKEDDYPQNSAHHGMAMSGDKLCMAGTIDDYTAIVSRPALTTDAFVHYPVGALPYWSLTSVDGNHCFVTLSNLDAVSVVDYRTGREVARVPVGDFPQRLRLGRLA
ncbi:serine/threonine protein kinase [Lentzea sp. NBRC 105346]|uniref:YncE family protein n=1 Tax=Lentzea sp. NBRC 105346 TaxID=3032205 RepID=UPI0024A37EB9|nr:serine/threonine protein kinase [Lentzea sp. NBRC 105346]GLZ28373.1 serine/threonine protein kinase [Lentzea sp. NBRC 105346]